MVCLDVFAMLGCFVGNVVLIVGFCGVVAAWAGFSFFCVF